MAKQAKKSAAKKKTQKRFKSTVKKSAKKKAAAKNATIHIAGPDLRKLAEGILAKAQEISKTLPANVAKTTRKRVQDVLLRVRNGRR